MIPEPQKNAILVMRRQGSSYRQIAESLMLSQKKEKTIF